MAALKIWQVNILSRVTSQIAEDVAGSVRCPEEMIFTGLGYLPRLKRNGVDEL